MTPQERAVAKKIASLMRAARKHLGLTQIEISQKLGISQSALSKVESGILIPSAPQWFDFCEMTGISADSLVTGYLERNEAAVLGVGKPEVGFKLPNKYATLRGSKVRALIPFVNFYQAAFGTDRYLEYLDFVGLDSDFFFDLDNQINLNFILDISKSLIRQGALKQRDLSKLLKPVSQPETHGALHKSYDNGETVANRLKILVMNSKQYECNFAYALEDQKKGSVEISVRPEKHLKDFNYKDDQELGDFLCKYKMHYFERFMSYGGAKGGSVEEKECHYHGAQKCVYQLKLAS